MEEIKLLKRAIALLQFICIKKLSPLFQPKAPQFSCFFDLPGEIRNQIYGYVYDREMYEVGDWY